MDEEAYQTHKNNVARSAIEGMASVNAMNLPLEIQLPEDVFGLGFAFSKRYRDTYSRLTESYGTRLSQLVAFALWETWFSCWEGAHWFDLSIKSGIVGNNEYTQEHCTASGYAKHEGWAYSLFNKMAMNSHAQDIASILDKFCFTEKPSDQDVLMAMSLYWMHQASLKTENSDISKLDLIYESSEADSLADGMNMWQGGYEMGHEKALSSDAATSTARIALAKAAASARHAPNQAMKAAAIAKYLAEKGRFASKDAAAMELTKDFPMEFGTIRAWLRNI